MAEAPLIPDQRRQKMLRLLARHDVLSVHQLTELLAVSHMTVRRDIAELEREGLAFTVPGGVRHARGVSLAPSFDAKSVIDGPQKAAIAAEASEYVRDSGTYYLDAGTTTAALLPAIRRAQGVTVITNDFAIVAALMPDEHVQVVHVGGRLDHANRSSVGALGALVLRQLAVDVAFVSATTWDLKRGLTSPDADKVDVKQAAMDVAASSVLLAASSKFGNYSVYRVAALDRFDRVVTDDGLPSAAAEGLADAGVDVVLAVAGTSPGADEGGASRRAAR